MSEAKQLRSLFVALLAVGLIVQTAFAKPTVSVKLSFDEDQLEGELEIKHPLGRQRIYKIQAGRISLQLPPERYDFRTRSLDERGVAGDWSDWQELLIKPKMIKWSGPRGPASEQSASPQTKKAKVSLQWPSGDGALKYRVVVSDSIGRETILESPETKLDLELPPGEYAWTIVSIAASGLESSASEPAKILIKGPQLQQPAGLKRSGFEILAQAPAAEFFHYKLEYHRFEQPNWSLLQELRAPVSKGLARFVLPADSIPGVYRITGRAIAQHWVDSDEVAVEFELKPSAKELPPTPVGWD